MSFSKEILSISSIIFAIIINIRRVVGPVGAFGTPILEQRKVAGRQRCIMRTSNMMVYYRFSIVTNALSLVIRHFCRNLPYRMSQALKPTGSRSLWGKIWVGKG